MEERLKKQDAHKTCVVFSQDMVPNILAPDYSPSIILRTYLDEGGRIVWLGEIPFYRKGKPFKNLKNLKSEEIENKKKEIFDEWGSVGVFSILGLTTEFNYSPTAKVEITERGKKWGLSEENRWYGTRPIMEGKRDVQILAQSSAKRYRTPDLLKPEEKQPSVLKEITGILSIISTIITVALGIATGFSSFYAITTDFELPILFLTLFFGTLFAGTVIRTLIKRFRRKKYANAWVKHFNKDFPYSGFVRIWDHIIYDVNDSMLEELIEVSTYNL